MITFTRKDYLKYVKQMLLGVNEKSVDYKLGYEEEKTHQYKDKIFKEILSNKKEFLNLMEKYLGDERYKELKEDDIEPYNKEFITTKFKRKEADIIYKVSNKDIYIIVEHQSGLDYTMPRRMFLYCTELIRDIEKNKKEITYPIIYPVVLYTGIKKWNIVHNIEKLKERMDRFKTYSYPEYNVIDINNYTKEELIQENTAISKALLFEKLETKEEVEEAIKKVIKKE